MVWYFFMMIDGFDFSECYFLFLDVIIMLFNYFVVGIYMVYCLFDYVLGD